MPHHLKNCLFLLILFTWNTQILCAGQDILSVEIWIELEPMASATATPSPLTEEEAYRRAFEEARFVFGGMIYGFDFIYTPSDNTRRVPEYFNLTPLAEIQWGDKNLVCVRREFKDKRLFALFTYELEDFQRARLSGWQSQNIPYEMGRGTGNVMLGETEKKTSFSMAIKDAVRNYLRPRIFNKPRQIRGQVLFLEGPLTVMQAGTYSTTVKIKVNIREIIPYTIH